ncbi:hypothetical protein GLYMA_11G222150v4 [Glycine max]|nr:hypothetical protein GLYMA_11G222150v4 [Glycine max]KAH1160310.1 hypothetical protein GYH30_031878 [Glycine max]
MMKSNPIPRSCSPLLMLLLLLSLKHAFGIWIPCTCFFKWFLNAGYLGPRTMFRLDAVQ